MRSYKKLPLLFLLGAVLIVPAFADDDEEYEGGSRLKTPPATNAKWKAECASCHTLYQPGFLPARSWRKLMSGLDKHFGENASLDAVTNKEITDFLVKYSADSGSSRIARSIPASSTPLRITDTPWFKREHDEVGANVWKRPKIGSPSNCAACHAGAEQGDFSERRVRIPR